MAVRLFNEEDWKRVSEDNRDLYDDYMLNLEAEGKAKKTRDQYGYDLRGFFSWLVREKNNKYVLDLKRRDFRNFFLILKRSGVSNARINRFQSSVRNLLEYACVSDEYSYQNNEMAHIKGLRKEPVREIVFLTDKQVNILIDELLKRKHFQKALWVSLAYDSAARRAELHQVQKEGFLDNNQTNVVVGKRSKKFRLIYFNRTKILFALWMRQRGEDDIPSLWVTGKGENKKPMSYTTMYGFVDEFRKILKKRTGEDILLNEHSFRHSAATNYENGTHFVLREIGKDKLDLRLLQTLMHHSDVGTTQNYLKDDSEERLANALGIEI